MKRREVIKNIGLLTITGGIAGALPASEAKAASKPKPKAGKDLFDELGVTKVINAGVTMTYLSGSLMLPEVMEAINSTSHDFANMYELQDKVGAKIAEMLQVEAAMVTSGASCAIVLATAACITGEDKEKIKMIPNLPGPRPEVIMPREHRIGYPFDQGITTTGAKIIEVTGPEEFDRAFNDRTVMTLFFNAAHNSSITHEDFVRISRKHGIPSFIDAAADVPPVENLFKYQKMGFDLVTFSGGKMIRGPQSAGLLFGRKDVIEAAKLNHSPHEAPIGRPMKVNKEEMFGMYAALKSYLSRDHQKEWQEWLDRIKKIQAVVEKIPGIKAETLVNPGPANAFPSLGLSWDEQKVKASARDVVATLRKGNPSIQGVFGNSKDGKSMMRVGVVLLRPDQVSVVAARLKDAITKG